jgi:AcrR family transcriptional regulator
MTEALENKDKLFQAATELFAAKGFKGTSIRDIADAAGMTTYNIYYYFGNKEGLLLAILEQSTRRVHEKLCWVTEQDMDPISRFKLFLETHIHSVTESPKEATIFSLGKEHLSPTGWEVVRRFQRDILEIYRTELHKLQVMGVLRSRSLTIPAFNIFGIINWLLRWYNPDGLLSKDELTDEIVSFILPGVITRATEEDKHGSGTAKAARSKLKKQHLQATS